MNSLNREPFNESKISPGLFFELQSQLQVFGQVSGDSLGSARWKAYLDPGSLISAWMPVEGSPWTNYMKTRAMNCVPLMVVSGPRYSIGEKRSEDGIRNLVERGDLNDQPAVFLEAGHAHSVAMSMVLARELGYQPVVTFNGHLDPNGIPTQEGLAALLYYSEEMKGLKESGKVTKNAAPAFVLDVHRSDRNVPNAYTFGSIDFPSSAELLGRGVRKVVYIDERNLDCKSFDHRSSICRSDSFAIIKSWEYAGIEIMETGVRPFQPEDMLRPEVINLLNRRTSRTSSRPESLISGN